MADKYRSYTRIHRSPHPSDAERSKIARETHRANRSAAESARAARLIVEDPENDQAHDTLANTVTSGSRDRRNARGHKTRLKKLSQERDFV